jgi:ATP/maltotriose-dependent transcriptional regulator MalT
MGRALALHGRFDDARAALDHARSEAEELGTRRLLWSVYLELSRLASAQGGGESAFAFLDRARSEIEFLVEQIADPKLVESFLNRPAVREITETV